MWKAEVIVRATLTISAAGFLAQDQNENRRYEQSQDHLNHNDRDDIPSAAANGHSARVNRED